MRQKILPSEGFLDKSTRLANSATSLVGTSQKIYGAGRFAHAGPKTPPPDGFLDKSIRLANSATSLIGTAKGLYEAGKFVYSGLQAARPLLALM